MYIRYDRVHSQVYTNSDPRLTYAITPVGQSHPVPTGASTPHSVHSYNDTHRYNNQDQLKPQPTRFTRPVSRKRDVTEPGRDRNA